MEQRIVMHRDGKSITIIMDADTPGEAAAALDRLVMADVIMADAGQYTEDHVALQYAREALAHAARARNQAQDSFDYWATQVQVLEEQTTKQ